MNTVLKILLGAVEGPLIQMGEEGLKKLLDDQWSKKPKRTAMFVSVTHAILKESGTELAKKTKIPYDDDVVEDAIRELEDFATEKGFTLSNFDDIETPAPPPPPPPVENPGS